MASVVDVVLGDSNGVGGAGSSKSPRDLDLKAHTLADSRIHWLTVAFIG